MDSLMKLIGEIGNAVHQIAPPEIQRDLDKAFAEYQTANTPKLSPYNKTGRPKTAC